MSLISLSGYGLSQWISNHVTHRNVLQDHLSLCHFITNNIVLNVNVFGFSMILRVLVYAKVAMLSQYMVTGSETRKEPP